MWYVQSCRQTRNYSEGRPKKKQHKNLVACWKKNSRYTNEQITKKCKRALYRYGSALEGYTKIRKCCRLQETRPCIASFWWIFQTPFPSNYDYVVPAYTRVYFETTPSNHTHQPLQTPHCSRNFLKKKRNYLISSFFLNQLFKTSERRIFCKKKLQVKLLLQNPSKAEKYFYSEGREPACECGAPTEGPILHQITMVSYSRKILAKCKPESVRLHVSFSKKISALVCYLGWGRLKKIRVNFDSLV